VDNSGKEIKEAKDVPKIRDLSSLTEQMKRKVTEQNMHSCSVHLAIPSKF
jgi:hypothetical protein